jgi:hypothetical protein
MTDRIKREVALVAAVHGPTDVDPQLRWFVFRHPMPAGWNKQECRIMVQVPPGYAVTPPDNFLTDADLRLDAGGEPGSSSVTQGPDGQQWRQFSYHIEAADWQPEKGHNLLTFTAGVVRRLKEAS